MPQSFGVHNAHFVFSTKNREPWIREEWAEDLYRFIAGVVVEHKSLLIASGGVADHIHLLISMARDVNSSDMMRVVKSYSSRWVHTNHPDLSFLWQVGYASIGIGIERVDGIRAYIARQKEHHATQSFQDEYRQILRENDQVWDERYVWD